MKIVQKQFQYSPTDLSNHINCKHLTELNKLVAKGELDKPDPYFNPSLDALIERGISFEMAYLERLKERGLRVVEIDQEDREAEQKTINALSEGVDVVYQARLRTDRWSGWADFIIKIDRPSRLGDWSYLVWDTKLATETKASTILQIGLYTQRLAEIQGLEPEFMGVMKPDGEDKFRYHDFAAYIRLVQQNLETALVEDSETYPEPVSHCDICRWWKKCNSQRRSDDHLTFVAGMGRSQTVELRNQGVNTLNGLAELSNPVPFNPEKGSVEVYNKLQAQAQIQKDSRERDFEPLHKLLEVEEDRGFYILPEPSEHDVFLDFEGARMVEPDGLEYLIGYFYQGRYTALWAKNKEEEKRIFEAFVDWVYSINAKNPEMHIYHYAPYEPAALKRLMGKYASRENEIDELLRSESFVDLYRVIRQSLIASVERYSLKDLEKFFGYEREMDLRDVSRPKSTFEYLLEINKAEEANDDELKIIEAYNKDDCHALIELQKWLELLRSSLIESGIDILRPEARDGEASENITEHQQRILPLFNALQEDLPILVEEMTQTQYSRYVLSHFLDWFRREDKSLWWEFFRLLKLDMTELLDERKAIAYLTYTGVSYQEKRSRVDVYSFVPQEVDVREGTLKNLDGENIGTLHLLDKENGRLEIKKSAKYQKYDHPVGVIQIEHISAKVKEESIIRLAQWVVQNSMDNEDPTLMVARKLLMRQAPPLIEMTTGTDIIVHTANILDGLEGDYLAIQGPPGAGKSYTGSHLILHLVQRGRSIGVTAMSHKVISNLLQKTYDLAQESGVEISIIQKGGSDPNQVPWTVTDSYDAIQNGFEDFNVIAGTSFMWAREEFQNSVDFMFIDEAGQLALIDTIALAQAATNLVLLGDPNQLQQPQQGVHPTGTQVSALEHILDGQQTMQEDQGIFLETTWRMHPSINSIVSELFYQNRLRTEAHLSKQNLVGNDSCSPGLSLIEVSHQGNTSSSSEEVLTVRNLVEELTNGNLSYVDESGNSRTITEADIKLISPYNAQVNLLTMALPGLEIGTVDKFQGQEAPIVIYSVASSSPLDAPRGMDFLYSPNRLNVAISRAKVLFIMVASPAVFDAECKSPREMKLANAYCRVKEITGSLQE